MLDDAVREAERLWFADRADMGAAERLGVLGRRAGRLSAGVIEAAVVARTHAAVKLLATAECWSGLGAIASGAAESGDVVTAAFKAALTPWLLRCLEVCTVGFQPEPKDQQRLVMYVTQLHRPFDITCRCAPTVRYARVTVAFVEDHVPARVRYVRANPAPLQRDWRTYAFVVLRPSARGVPGDILAAGGVRGPLSGYRGSVFAPDNGAGNMFWFGPGKPLRHDIAG